MRKLVAWLSKRFPVQLVVSLDDWQRLDNGLNGLSNSLIDLNRRLGAVETQIRRLNESQGFSPLTKAGIKLER